MADFGQDGKLTHNQPPVGTVDIDFKNGEHLHFKISPKGAGAIFSLACNHDPKIWDATAPHGNPDLYERTWPKDADEIHKAFDLLSLAVYFSTAVSYNVIIELQGANHTVKQTLMNYDCSSNVPTDNHEEVLMVKILQ